MGSGASTSGEPKLPWPPGPLALLHPGAELPAGLKINAPEPCREKGIPYWQLGGKAKARLRITEDEEKLLKLGEQFTVAICCRVGEGDAAGYDSLLLGEDNKHWLAVKGGEGTICSVEGESGAASEVDGKVEKTWTQLFLRPSASGGTEILGVDEVGLFSMGLVETSLVGSKLRQGGWASNEVEVAAIGIWDRTVPWAELCAAVEPSSAPEPPEPPSGPPGPQLTRFRGKIVDLVGEPMNDVRVSWFNGSCVSDKDGEFQGECEDDAETTVPADGASQGSGGSDSSWLCLSFEREGYAPTSSSTSLGLDSSMQVTMREISASVTFDAAAGGSVIDATSGSSVTMSPNSLVYPDGTEVTGPVNVSLALIDVTTPEGLATMPGNFSAVGNDGKEVMLQSLGAAWVGATDAEGRQLEMKEGSGYTLDLQTEAKADAAKLAALPEMWSFDERSGKWQLEPSEMKINGQDAPNAARPENAAPRESTEELTKEEVYEKRKKGKKKGSRFYDPTAIKSSTMPVEEFMKQVAKEGKKSMSAKVYKMGYINCDIAYESPTSAVMMQGRVLDAKGQPRAEVQVISSSSDYGGMCYDATDSAGCFKSLIAQFDSQVHVNVTYQVEKSSDEEVEVFFSKAERPDYRHPKIKLLNEVPGRYQKTISMEDGQPVWEQTDGRLDQVKIAWNARRKCWQNIVQGEVLFTLPAGDDPGLPFSDAWRSSLEKVFAPRYTRGFAVTSQSFGPFKTGDPGKLVEVGDIKLKA
mmetsp:Transcript_11107/g.19825  ORF Transcript_11107/g.19825 Transcript_11107/m.19825 type:complete len:752 (+) Transcript_11107:21-2276(+)